MTDTPLTTTWNLGTDGDGLYALLMAAHEGLSEDESARLNVRLVLLMMNHIGDRAVLEAAIAAARSHVGRSMVGSAPTAAGRAVE